MLPDKASSLIRVALEDMEKCEADGGYVINMGTYHRSFYDGTCHVCFAGVVMAQSLNVPKGCTCYPSSFISEPGVTGKLRALDCFRQGHVAAGLEQMGLPTSGFANNWIGYSHDDKFKERMRKLADQLEAAGL